MRSITFSYALLTKYLFSIIFYAFLVLPIQNANAINLDVSNLGTEKKEANFLFDNSIIKISSLILKETEISDVFNLFKENYLTLYSTKNETIDASYSKGRYYINYTSNW